MKWGLIVRSETDRGLGVQTYAMWQNLKPDRTLLVLDYGSGFRSHPELYPGAAMVSLLHGPDKNRLDEQTVRHWWQGLDVVFTVETFYDWDLVEWAKRDNVKTLAHGNPEFWMATNPQPDMWAWPTAWRTDLLPEGPVVPVPAPDRPIIAANPTEGFSLKAVHIAGNRALGDRNGTETLAMAMQQIPIGVELTTYSQATMPKMYNVEHRNAAEDRWDMYVGQHMLVLPRRYGGLCLPAIEAMASGLAVAMTDCVPNHMWPIISIPAVEGKLLKMQTGEVRTSEATANGIANILKDFSYDRTNLAEQMSASVEWAHLNSWDVHRQTYYDLIEKAANA